MYGTTYYLKVTLYLPTCKDDNASATEIMFQVPSLDRAPREIGYTTCERGFLVKSHADAIPHTVFFITDGRIPG